MAQTDTAPFSAFERMIAGRYLRARRKEGFISVIAGFSFVGILLGVATLIIVMAVMNGFRTELLGKVLGFNGHAMVYSANAAPIPDFEERAARLAATPGVVRAIPFTEGQAMASSARASTGVLIRGMKVENLQKLTSVMNDKLRGSLEGFDEGKGVAVGHRLAWQHGLNIGDQITLVSPEGPATIFGTAPRIRSFPIIATFEIGMSEYDKSVIYMPMTEAQDFFAQEDGASAIEVMVEDPDDIDDYVPAMAQNAGADLQFVTWKTSNQTFFNALQVERNVMFLILTLIILVAALNIISGLIMLVKDKGKDIAILRTMGATRGSILRIFFMTGAAIGLAGTFAGIILGVVVCLNIENIRQGLSWLSGKELFSPELYYLSRMPAEMNVNETMMIALMAIGLSFIATIYPARRAARLDPVEALRYE
ncbi:MAG: lipoprotein-releasing ABC transporter permease subunit [Anderseniella sp.]|jgi:lipoprotein-releasing system permease protein|nr:lipoprotein-releasing ABC transporter permease subunit [Anderseniella sp.]